MKHLGWVRSPALLLAILLALAGMAILLQVTASLRELGRQERVLATRVVMESVAATLERARQLGVPLGDVVGLDQLVDARLPANLGVARISLVNKEGQELWRHGLPGAHRDGEALTVPVGDSGARLVVTLDDDAHRPAMLRLAVVLLLVAVALAIPELELAHYVDLLRYRFARRLLARQVDAVREGDLRSTWRTTAGGGDPRLHQLRDQVHLLNERHQRVSRLLGSLQRTEPDADKRAELGQLLPTLAGRFRFSGSGAPEDRASWPAIGSARHFGQLTLLLANLGLWLAPLGSEPVRHLLLGLLALSVGLLAGSRWAPAAWPHRLLGALGLAALVNALAASGLPWLGLLSRLGAGVAVAWALSAAQQAEQQDAMRDEGPLDGSADSVGWRDLLLAGAVAGPLLGLAMVEALGQVWLGVGSVLAASAALTLALLLPNDEESPSPPRPAAGRSPSRVAGAGWFAACALMLILLPGGPGRHEDGSITLMLLAAPAPLLLLLQSRRGLAWLPALLLAAAALAPLQWPGLLGLPWLLFGAAMSGAAFFLALPPRARPDLGGAAQGALASSLLLSLVLLGAPQALVATAQALLLACLLAGLFTRRTT